MKLSDIMTIYTVAIDILAIALLLTADCFAHRLIAICILLVNLEIAKKP